MSEFWKFFYYSLIIALGSMTMGQVSSYLGPTRSTLVKDLELTDFETSMFNWLGMLFGAVGGVLVHPLCSKFGRRTTVLIMAITAIVFWILTAVTEKSFYWLLFVGRAGSGIAMGLSASVCTMYIIELNPIDYRGYFGPFHQVFLAFGTFWDYLLGIWLTWKPLTYCMVVFHAIQCLLLFTVPDSSVVEANIEHESIFQKKFLVTFFQSLMFFFTAQVGGINPIMSTVTKIFEDADTSLEAKRASIVVSVFQLFGAAISSNLVQRLGRKPSWIISSAGCAIGTFLLFIHFKYNAWNILPIISLVIYVVFFAIGLGPIPWMIVPELFPDSVRSTFMSIMTVANWIFSTVAVFMFPEIGTTWGCFFFFIINTLGLLFGIFLMPETKRVENVNPLEPDVKPSKPGHNNDPHKSSSSSSSSSLPLEPTSHKTKSPNSSSSSDLPLDSTTEDDKK